MQIELTGIYSNWVSIVWECLSRKNIEVEIKNTIKHHLPAIVKWFQTCALLFILHRSLIQYLSINV